ncbi:asparaginase, partial [Micrococcus endophyticus]
MTRVHVLATGGTIASRSGEGSGATAGDSAEVLLEGMDATADVEVTSEDVMTVGSYRLGLPELATIARVSRERAEEPGIDGVVVTHGTDTMEETAFLADLLNGTDTPVVFTGAQRAADHPDTDGPRNLRQAVLAAAHPNARGLGALVAFDGLLLSARGTRKGHTMVSQPFTGGTLVGTTHGDEFRLHARPHRPGTLDLPDSGLDGVRVDLITAYPGADPAA